MVRRCFVLVETTIHGRSAGRRFNFQNLFQAVTEDGKIRYVLTMEDCVRCVDTHEYVSRGRHTGLCLHLLSLCLCACTRRPHRLMHVMCGATRVFLLGWCCFLLLRRCGGAVASPSRCFPRAMLQPVETDVLQPQNYYRLVQKTTTPAP
jgi:hypothetical protein